MPNTRHVTPSVIPKQTNDKVAKLQKLRAQADLYARRLERERSMAEHPAGAKPYADMVAKDPTGVRAVHAAGCRAAECDSCGVTR